MSAWLALGAALASVCAGALAAACWLWATRMRTAAPGPRALPLLGNVLHFNRQPVLLDLLGELHRRYGDVFRFYVGPKLVIVVTQPEDVKEVLITKKQQERDPYFTRLMRFVIGNGLLTNTKETWKTHRKLIEPVFHFEALQTYLDTFNKEAHTLCENLNAHGGAEVDMYPAFCLNTLRSAVSTIGGMELERLEPDACSQVKLSAEISHGLQLVSKMLFLPWKNLNSILWMSFEGRELKRIRNICNKITQRYIDVSEDETCCKERKTLTSLLSEAFLEKTEIENVLRDELMTLATTSSDTTAGTMGYALVLLSLHPEWQEKAHRELDQVFGAGGDYLRPVTPEDLPQLTVTEAIIKESLRLFPPAPILPRLVDEDIPLAGGRYVAPRGSCVFVALFLMHRHPALFPDPDKFDPGRFLPGGSATSRRSHSYLPFSTGPRRCLGEQYASMEMKILVATVLRRFRLIPGSSREELETTLFSITSHPLTGFRVSFVPRKYQPSNWCGKKME